MSDDPLPPPPGSSKVEIGVAGHTITVESPEPLDVVAAKALDLFRQTSLEAGRIPTGFDVTGGSAEREPYTYADSDLRH